MILPACEDRIHQASSTWDVANERLDFRTHGANPRAACPFHNGKNYNLCYYAATDSLYCHKCHVHISNAADFLMQLDGLTYPQALRELAKRYGIEVEETHQNAEAKAEAARKKSMLEAYDVVCEWYEEKLWEGADAGTSAAAVRQYLHTRGLEDDTLRTFRLGFSPMDSHALGRHLLAEGHSQALLVDAHLLYPNQDGTLFDKYHGRLIFFLHDTYGRCIGYSGRNLKKDAPASIPKYINSSESPIFQKRHTLYGYHLARAAMARTRHAYLVEGFTDVMMMHQCGIYNVVASQGTAICPEQALLLRKQCTHVTILLDGDAPGIAATERALEILLDTDLVCDVVTLPDGEDPCSYGLHHGATALCSAVAESSEQRVDFIQWLWNGVTDKSSVDERAACVKKVGSLIGKVKDVVYRGEYVRRGCDVLGVEKEVLSFDSVTAGGTERSSVSGAASGGSTRRASRGDFRRSGRQGKRWRQDEIELRAIEPLRLELGRLRVGDRGRTAAKRGA